MNKKDIYEHLANIYLDAAQKRRVRIQAPQIKNHLFITLSLSVIAALSILTFAFNPALITKHASKEFFAYSKTVRLNNDINPVEHNRYNIDLKRKNLKSFDLLQFCARKTNFPNKVKLKVEVLNSNKQRASLYINNLTEKWQTYEFSLNKFEEIKDWSSMLKLTLVMESNTIEPKKHSVLINDIKFIK